MAKTDPVLNHAFYEVNLWAMSPEERFAYISADMRKESDKSKQEFAVEEAEKRGIEQGTARGERLAAQQIAKNLLLQGLPFDLIQKTTGLSLEEIKKIRTPLQG